MLEIKRYARKRIYHVCLVRIEKYVPRDHCLANVVLHEGSKTILVHDISMTILIPRDHCLASLGKALDGFFYPHLTPMKDTYILAYLTGITITGARKCRLT